jgi:hypothetical protein
MGPHGHDRAMHRLRSVPTLGALTLVAATLLLGCRFPSPRIEVASPPPDELVARGAYLANNVMICTTCHSERDWRYYGGPPREGTAGLGGEGFTDLFLFPEGTSLHSDNLTPTALGDWTDGEIARAIAGGLDRDGEMIFLVMPINQYRTMAKPDMEAVIAYLRSLHPEETEPVPDRELRFRVLRDVGWMFVAPPALQPAVPGRPGSARRGQYLTNMASCRWCHTATDILGFPVPGKDWAGGMGFPVPEPGGGFVFSSNLTPHKKTGIGAWSEEVFIARFRASKEEAVRASPLSPGGFNSPMAWSAYSGMTDEDLAAIYRYLRTLPPVANPTPRWLPYTPRRKANGVYDYDTPAEPAEPEAAAGP